MRAGQLSFDLQGGAPAGMSSSAIAAAVETLATQGGTEARGAVFTRSEVVDFILDLVGYTEDQPLHLRRLLEPSFGGGEFLFSAIARLLTAWRRAGDGSTIEQLCSAICAVELHRDTFTATRTVVVEQLMTHGITLDDSTRLADAWLVQGDYLLAGLAGDFDYVVGNPPYVRQELIPAPLLAEYRARYPTLYDRADLYIPFIERSLLLLKPAGWLGFICADRWMKNRYGGPLRALVAERFRLRAFVDMVDTPAFLSEVSAYPAITVISRDKPGATRMAYRPSLSREALTSLALELRSELPPAQGSPVREVSCVAIGDAPWLLEGANQLSLVRRLESSFPTLEEAGCKVGIGVATGADKAFIGNFDALDVEADRKLKLVTTRDIQSGQVRWHGQGVINPFADDGQLVDLADYPRLRAYLEQHRAVLAGRHCAQKIPANWYRTIDRIDPALAIRAKLLVPDIKGSAHIVYESGGLYPHHNLYHITAKEWDLRALQAVLLSGVARLFVAAYSTRMRGGYLRFQAQYLRRIRVPHWHLVPDSLRVALIDAAIARDIADCTRAVVQLYGLSDGERAVLCLDQTVTEEALAHAT